MLDYGYDYDPETGRCYDRIQMLARWTPEGRVMDKPTSIRGRKLVGPLWYYACHCGEPRGPLLLTSFEGLAQPVSGYMSNSILISGEGTLFLFREGFAVNMHQDIKLKRVVGRRACTCACAECTRKQAAEGDHVWYDWDFRMQEIVVQ